MTHRWLQAWWTAPRVRLVLLDAFISLCLAFLIWLYIHSRARETLDHVPIPVNVSIAPGQRDLYLLEIPGTPRVTASFAGPASRIRELRRKLQDSQMKIAVEYSVAGGRENEAMFQDVVRVEPSQVPAPPDVTVELIQQTRGIPLTVHRLVERTVPIKLETTGEARVIQLKLEPAVALVRGPKTLLDRTQAIATVPYAVTVPHDAATDALVKDQVALVTDLEGRDVQVTPAQVTFRCKLVPKKKTYELHDVPVHFLCPIQFPWRPRFVDERHGKISLKLVGPAVEDLPPVLAYIDLTKGNYGRGRNLEPVRLQLPKDFQLADTAQPLVAFELMEMERASAAEEESVDR